MELTICRYFGILDSPSIVNCTSLSVNAMDLFF
jgi:hypothetical protein